MGGEKDISVVGPPDIDSTASLDRSYRLLAAPESLVAWTKGAIVIVGQGSCRPIGRIGVL